MFSVPPYTPAEKAPITRHGHGRKFTDPKSITASTNFESVSFMCILVIQSDRAQASGILALPKSRFVHIRASLQRLTPH